MSINTIDSKVLYKNGDAYTLLEEIVTTIKSIPILRPAKNIHIRQAAT